jgi:hypothetical protein
MPSVGNNRTAGLRPAHVGSRNGAAACPISAAFGALKVPVMFLYPDERLKSEGDVAFDEAGEIPCKASENSLLAVREFL